MLSSGGVGPTSDRRPRGCLHIVNELQEQVAKLQKIVGADVRKMDVQTDDLGFEYVETQDDIDDQKLIAPFKDKIPVSKYPIKAKRAQDRIYGRKARARKAAEKAKVEVLEALKAELEVEVKALKARKAVMPGSAVFHS